MLTIPSIFGSYIYGHLVDRFGAKRSLMMTLMLWIVLLAVMIAVPGKNAFWLVGLAIGLNFGGVPTAERPVLLSLVPDVEAGRYFSLDAAVVARRGDRRSAHLGSHRRRARVAIRNRDRLSRGRDDRRGDVRHRGVHSSRRSRSIARNEA